MVPRDDAEEYVHPVPFDGPPPTESPGGLQAETLVNSVLILLTLTVVQRMVGFVREILFCRWLNASQLGEWDLSFGFLMLAAPLAVLSLPGTFPRYVERYRRKGQLGSFLRRTALVCAALALPAAAVVCLARSWFSHLIFGRPDQTLLVALLAASLTAVIAFNFLDQPVHLAAEHAAGVDHGTGRQLHLRRVGRGADVPLAVQRRRGHRRLRDGMPADFPGRTLLVAAGLGDGARRRAPPPSREIWSQLLPFAVWLMMINMLTTLFDLADRQMIIHCSVGDALAEVGNYRSSRVVPLLLASVTAMIAAVATPHLSVDWEAGRRDRVSDQLNLLLKVLAAGLTLGGVLILAAAPLVVPGRLPRKILRRTGRHALDA